MCRKICLSCFNDFSLLHPPPRISNELFESRRIKLETSSGLRIFGAKFCVFFQSQKPRFQPLLPQKGHIWPNLHLKISPQNSEAPMRFQAYSFEIQKVQMISWIGLRNEKVLRTTWTWFFGTFWSSGGFLAKKGIFRVKVVAFTPESIFYTT